MINMPAAVETMFSAREVPWHGLGVITDDVLTAKEAIVTAGLDWEVEKRPIWTQTGDKKSKVRILDKHAMVRVTDERVLGVVGSKYTPFQNREAFDFADAIVDSGEAKYETAGSLKDGRTIFLTMKLGDEFLINGEDVHQAYLALRTSHDGTKAIGACITMIRIVCSNTESAAFGSAKWKWSMPHTASALGKIEEARKSLRLSFAYKDAYVDFAGQLMNLKVTDEDVRQLLEGVLPDRPKTEEVIGSIITMYHESPTNGYTGTGWGAYNAITEYLDHGRNTTAGPTEARLTNALDGSLVTIREAAAKQLLSMTK